MTIVTYAYRRRRARKRKQSPAISMRIVSARKPGPAAPVIKETATERKPAQPATISGPRIVTALRKRAARFGPVQDIDAEDGAGGVTLQDEKSVDLLQTLRRTVEFLHGKVR